MQIDELSASVFDWAEPVQVEVELEERKMGILSWRDMSKWDKSAAKQKSEWGAEEKRRN